LVGGYQPSFILERSKETKMREKTKPVFFKAGNRTPLLINRKLEDLISSCKLSLSATWPIFASPLKPGEALWLRTGYSRLSTYLKLRGFDDAYCRRLFRRLLSRKSDLYRAWELLQVPIWGTSLTNRLNDWYARCEDLDGIV